MENPIEQEDAFDEAEDIFDDDSDLRENQMDSYSATYPQSPEQQNLYNWFWKVVKEGKSFRLIKVGKLTKEEIGKHGISIRDSMNLFTLGCMFHHPKFGGYFANIAKINSASSMSKDGWFMDLSISQKKVRERTKHSLEKGEQPWRIFRKKNQPSQED